MILKAINDKVEDGKVVSSEDVNDALQITDFDGKRIAVTDFGKNLANALIMQQLPDVVKDVIGYRQELEKMHGNAGIITLTTNNCNMNIVGYENY